MTPSSYYQDEKSIFLKNLYNDLTRKSNLSVKEKKWLNELKGINLNQVAQQEDIAMLIDEIKGRLNAKRIKSEKEEKLLSVLKEFSSFDIEEEHQVIPFEEYFELIDDHLTGNVLRLDFSKSLTFPENEKVEPPYLFQYVASTLNVITERLHNACVPVQAIEILSSLTSGLMLVIVNEDDAILYVNECFLKQSNKTRKNVIGKPILNFLSNSGVLQKLVDSSDEIRIELIFEKHILDVNAKKHNLGVESGFNIFIFSTVDKIQEHLQLAALSYDTLTTTSAALELLKETKPNTNIIEHLDFQVSMEKLLDYLNERARDNMGRLISPDSFNRLQLIDFSCIITHVIDILKPNPSFSNIKFNIEIEENINFFGFEMALCSVLQTLLGYSVFFRRNNKTLTTISIVVKSEQDKVEIVFTDDAAGLLPQSQTKVLHKIIPNNHPSGIAIYLCQKILDEMNGKINIKYVRGKGTTTSIIFPNDNPFAS